MVLKNKPQKYASTGAQWGSLCVLAWLPATVAPCSARIARTQWTKDAFLDPLRGGISIMPPNASEPTPTIVSAKCNFHKYSGSTQFLIICLRISWRHANVSASSLYSLEDTKGWDVYVPAKSKSNRHVLHVSENLTGRNKRDDYKKYTCELKKENAQSYILLSLAWSFNSNRRRRAIQTDGALVIRTASSVVCGPWVLCLLC